jgi:hypothetical protein
MLLAFIPLLVLLKPWWFPFASIRGASPPHRKCLEEVWHPSSYLLLYFLDFFIIIIFSLFFYFLFLLFYPCRRHQYRYPSTSSPSTIHDYSIIAASPILYLPIPSLSIFAWVLDWVFFQNPHRHMRPSTFFSGFPTQPIALSFAAHA